MSIDIKKIINTDTYIIQNGVFFVGEQVQSFQDIPRGEVTTAANKNTWSRWRMANYDFFKKSLDKLEGKYLLDLGAGPQQFGELTRKFDVCAVDTFPDKGIHVVCDINNKLPFLDNTFDVAFLSNVLEHVYNWESLLSELHRVLKQNGVIIGTVPFLMLSHQRPHDYFRYTDICLNKMLKDAHFVDVAVEPLGSPVNVLRSMQHKFFGLPAQSLKNRFFKRVFRKIMAAIFWLYELIFNDIKPNAAYTEGYGFYAKK